MAKIRKALKYVGKRSQVAAKNKIQQIISPNKATRQGQVIEGKATEPSMLEMSYDNVQQLFRHQFPVLSKKALGSKYTLAEKAARFLLPNGIDQISDEVLELAYDVAERWGNTEYVLEATGAETIQELQKDAQRSYRAANALKERNKLLATLQGGLSGLTGMLGAITDLPVMLLCNLKLIYEIGHSYGFELDREEDQEVINYILQQIDLGAIAEKQMLFFSLAQSKQILTTQNFQELENILDSQHSFEQFKDYLEGRYEIVLKVLSHLRLVRHILPFVSGFIGASYSRQSIESTAKVAQEVFFNARSYFIDHALDIGILEAYRRQVEREKHAIEPLTNSAIVDVKLVQKTATEAKETPASTEQTIHEGIEQLAEAHVSEAQITDNEPAATDQPSANDTIVEVKVEKQAENDKDPTSNTEQTIHEGIEQLAEEYVTDANTAKQHKDN